MAVEDRPLKNFGGRFSFWATLALLHFSSPVLILGGSCFGLFSAGILNCEGGMYISHFKNQTVMRMPKGTTSVAFAGLSPEKFDLAV